MVDDLLEAWEWPMRDDAGEYNLTFNTISQEWYVVGRSGLSPVTEYAAQQYAGANGYFLGAGRSGGLEPEVTLVYGDEDRLEVARAVDEIMSSITLGGSPLAYEKETGSNDGNVRVKPYGSKVYWAIDAALKEKTVEYTETGCVATVTFKWITPQVVWRPSREIPDPNNNLIGSTGGSQPW